MKKTRCALEVDLTRSAEVILQPDSNGNYKMAVPNNFLYKCPVPVLHWKNQVIGGRVFFD